MLGKQPVEVKDDLVLTQYGERYRSGALFRDQLRIEQGETEISLIYGPVTAEQASLIVTKSINPLAAIRTTRVYRLRGHGFRVVHSPTRYNSLHVSVYAPVLPTGDPAEWDDDLAKSFNQCFTGGVSGGDNCE